MEHIVLYGGYKVRFYMPKENHLILALRVARFFGCQHARMMHGWLSMKDVWSSRESLYHIITFSGSMPIHKLQDTHQCFHVVDDWEENGDID